MSTQPVEAAGGIVFPNYPPATVVDVEPLPVAPVSTGLATIAARPETRQALVCSQMLDPQVRQVVDRMAAKLYPEMLADQTKVMTYGSDALVELNALVDRLLKEVEPVRIPELNGMMKDLKSNMNAIEGKYPTDDPNFRQEYEDRMNGVKRWFRKAKDYVSMIKVDIQNMEKQLNDLEKDLAGRQFDMTRNVVYYNHLYAENEKGIIKLFRTIAVMEVMTDLAKQQAASIRPDPSNPADRSEEQRQQLADFISTMEVKIGDFKGRLFMAWATAPRTRMMRNLDVGLSNKLSTLVYTTIPMMKMILVEWRMQVVALENAQVVKAVDAMGNEMAARFFESGAEAAVQMAEAINSPMIWPETMRRITTALDQAADGMLNAYQAGQQKRAEVDQAMLETHQVLGNVNRKVDDAVIGRVIATANDAVPAELMMDLR